MTAGRVDNLNGTTLCHRCGNSGWVYFKEMEWTRGMNGVEFQQPVMAPCGWCAVGHRHHDRFPKMPWGYRVEDVDLNDSGRRPTAREVRGYVDKIKASWERGAREKAEALDWTRTSGIVEGAAIEPAPTTEPHANGSEDDDGCTTE